MRKAAIVLLVLQACLATAINADTAVQGFSGADGETLAGEFLLVCLNRHGKSDEVILGAKMLNLPAASEIFANGFMKLPKRYVELATFESVDRMNPYILRLSGSIESETKASLCEVANPLIAPVEVQKALQWLKTQARLGEILAMSDSDGSLQTVYDGTYWAAQNAASSRIVTTFPMNKNEPGLSLMFLVSSNSN